MTVHAAFAEELAGSQNSDDRLLGVLGQDGDFDLAFLDVVHGVGSVALLEYVFIFFKLMDGLAHADLGEKVQSVKGSLGGLLHRNLPQAWTGQRRAKRTPSGIEIDRGKRSTQTCALVGSSVGQYCSVRQINEAGECSLRTSRRFTASIPVA